MGLFNKSKTKEVEETVLQKMMNSQLLDDFIWALENKPEYEWIKIGSRGERGYRVVMVEPQGFIIKQYDPYEINNNNNVHIAIGFEESGYSKIESYYHAASKVDISCSRMCLLYAKALQNRMTAVMKDCSFSEARNSRNMDKIGTGNGISIAVGSLLDIGARAIFDYHVPVPSSSDLF